MPLVAVATEKPALPSAVDSRSSRRVCGSATRMRRSARRPRRRVALEQARDRVEERLVGRAHRIAEHHADAGEPAERARLDLAERVRDLARS